jgi:Outer membrane protein beta-barrel domain
MKISSIITKSSFFTLLFLAALNIASAQEIRFGIFANPLISWMKTDVSQIKSNGPQIGFDAGLMMDKFFAKRYAFSTGISINNMGGTLVYKDGKRGFQTSDSSINLNSNAGVKYNLQYIHIPFALKFKTTEIGYITYFAQVGLDPMINIKSRASLPGFPNVNAGKEINPLYLAYHISAGLEYRIVGNTSLMAGLTYMNGFTDVTDNSGSTSEKTVINRFELRLGVIF